MDLISGTVGGVSGPALNHWPVQGAMVTLDPGATLEYVLPAHHRAFAYMIDGEARVAGRVVRAGRSPGPTRWAGPRRTAPCGSPRPTAESRPS